jgi:transcriptional regulator with GAF, ATPase, and Fis domain/predicted ATPase
MELQAAGNTLAGRYEIVRALGEGGQAHVFLALDLIRGRQEVALKVLKTQTARSEGFKREFEALAALRHPHLISVLDYGTTDEGAPFFSCEYFPGQDLIAALKDASLDERLDVLAQVLRGLEYIHTRNLIHFDVKPHNLLVRRTDAGLVVKIADFGLAAPADGSATPRGTPHYLAPEVARGAAPADRRADLYSLGVVAYELFCGVRPYEGETALEVIQKHLEDRPIPPRERGAQLPEALERVILKLLEKEPAHRFSSANEVMAALNETLGRSFEFETSETKEAYVLSGKFVGRDRELDWLVEAYRAAVDGEPVTPGDDDPREFDRRARFAIRRGDPNATATAEPREAQAQSAESERRRGGDRRARRREAPLPPPPALLVFIAGESGVGKTRLLDELKRRAQVQGASVLAGTCRKHHSRAYEPFVDIVRQLPIAEANGSGWAVRRLLSGARSDEEDDKVERLRLIDAVTDLLLHRAQKGPLVLTIENLQWARGETLELLLHLHRSLVALRGSGAVPRLLVVATYRPEEVRGPELGRSLKELRRDRFFEELTLRPLRTDDASELIVSMLGVPDVPRRFVERVMNETLGNPLFIEQLMAELVSSGLIDRRRGLWRFDRERADALEVPNRVGVVVLNRVARWPEEQRDVLDTLAVLDRPASIGFLARTLGRDDPRVANALDSLIKLGAVARADDRYGFAHAKTRDVIFNAVEKRTERHDAIARALESGADGEADLSEYAHHLLEARANIDAIEIARRAAEHASSIGAAERACELYQRALAASDTYLASIDEARRPKLIREKLALLWGYVRELSQLDRLGDARARTLDALAAAQLLGDEQEEVRALAELGTLNARLKEYEDAKRCLFESLKSAERIAWKPGIGASLVGLGDLELSKGQLDEALQYLERSLAFEKELGDCRAVARSLRGLANALAGKGDLDAALAQCDRALELDRKFGDKNGEGETLELLARVSFEKGDLEQALEATESALELARVRDDKGALARGLLALGAAHDRRGEISEARKSYEEAARLARRLGHKAELARALNNLGWTRHLEGDYDEAIARFNEATTLWNTLGDKEGYGHGLSNLGLAYGRTGDLVRAAACYDAALRTAWESSNKRRDVEASWGRAEIAALRGELGRAREALDKAAIHAQELGGREGKPPMECGIERGLEALVLGSLAKVLARQGERARSQRAAQRAITIATEIRERASATKSFGFEEANLVARVELSVATAALLRGEIAGAIEPLRNRETWLRGSRERALAVAAELAFSRASAALGDERAARAAAETALAEAKARGLKPLASAARLARAEALLLGSQRIGRYRLGRSLIPSDELHDARVSFEAALAAATEAGAAETAFLAKLGLARVSAVEGEFLKAREVLAEAKEDALLAEDALAKAEIAVLAVEVEASGGEPALAIFLAKDVPASASSVLRARFEAARAAACLRTGKQADARSGLDEALSQLDKARAGLGAADGVTFDEGVLAQAIAAVGKDELPQPAPAARGWEPARIELDRAFQSRLLSLIRAAHEVNSTDALETQLALVLDGAVAAFAAERGVLIKVGEKGALKVRAARGTGGELALDDRSISASIANQVAQSGAPLIVADAQSDLGFKERQSIADLRIRSILGVPLRAGTKTTHVLVLEHRAEAGRFTPEDRDLCEAFADLAALAIERTRLATEARRREAELASRADEIVRLNAALAQKVEEQTHELEDVRTKLSGRERELEVKYNYANIVGRSDAMRRVFRLLDKVADSDVPVLIYGESGTGKELVAKAIHWNGPRKKKEFLSINCAALPEQLLEAELFGYVKGAFTGADRDKKGLFEAAHGGTLFLDEVGDMSPAMQTKLLRTLQEGEVRPVGAKAPLRVDVRIVSASNKDLRQLVEDGRFRADLFYRLNVLGVRLPPLRERKEDIPLLVDHFLEKIATQTQEKKRTFDRKVIEILTRYDWPGNVRELENELRRLVALAGSRITDRDLSTHIRGSESETLIIQDPGPNEGLTLKQRVEQIERRILLDSLKRHDNNKTRTAKALGLSRYGFLKKLDKYRLRSGSVDGDEGGEEDGVEAPAEGEDAED